jgi:hypothetical protein
MKKRFIYLAVLAAGTAAFHILTPCKPLMTAISEFSLKIKQLIDRLCAVFPFSVAEALVIAAIAAAVVFIILSIIAILKAKRRGYVLLRRLSLAAAALLSVYFLLCVF